MLWTGTERAIGRRRLLGLGASGLAWALTPAWLRAESGRAVYLSARADEAGRFRVSGFDVDGRLAFDRPLPGRGHGFAVRADGRVAVHFARRPGRFAQAIDLVRGNRLGDFTTPGNRHFYGHGAFSGDGRLLYASENDFAAGRGVIGVYDAARGYRRFGELPAHGIGPHELRLLPDGETLVVANGGIRTRPDLPRVKLNLPTMSPSLVYIDRRDGRLLEEVRLDPELHRLSIRHLAIGRDDGVAVAMQYEGPAGDLVPLVATHRRGDPLRPLAGPPRALRAMKHYCGSAAFDRDGRVLAVSAPRGSLVTFWDVESGGHLSSVTVADGSGVAPGRRRGEFVASSGRGAVVVIDARRGAARRLAPEHLDAGRWDNHLALAQMP